MVHRIELSPDDPMTELIPREEWESFLNDFTDFNAEMPATIYLMGPAEPELLAEHQPLLGVTLDMEAGTPLILIGCGDPAAVEDEEAPPTSLRHVIREPYELLARKLEPAGWDALQISARDASVLLTIKAPRTHRKPQESAREELIRAGQIGKAIS